MELRFLSFSNPDFAQQVLQGACFLEPTLSAEQGLKKTNGPLRSGNPKGLFLM